MLKRKDKVVATLTKGVEGLFKKNKVTRYIGHGRIGGPGQILVESNENKTELNAKHIIIATGSKPAALPGIELAGDLIGTSTEALAYSKVPEHLVVIGAGYIGLELGSVWRRLGAKVTVLEYLPRILPGMDSDIATEAQKLFEYLQEPVTSQSLVTVGALESASPIPLESRTLKVQWDRLLEDLEMATMTLKQIFLR